MPKSEVVCNGLCFEVLFLVKSDALKFDQGLRNHIAVTQIACLWQIWDGFPMNRKQCISGVNLIKSSEWSILYQTIGSVYTGRNEIITPEELNTLWERSPSAVPREPNHETWSGSVRGTGKQPRLLSFIESTLSQRIRRKQKTSCLKCFCLLQVPGKNHPFEVLTN